MLALSLSSPRPFSLCKLLASHGYAPAPSVPTTTTSTVRFRLRSPISTALISPFTPSILHIYLPFTLLGSHLVRFLLHQSQLWPVCPPSSPHGPRTGHHGQHPVRPLRPDFPSRQLRLRPVRHRQPLGTTIASTESFEDSPRLGRNTGVFVERDICTTRHDHREGLPGRGTTHTLFGVHLIYLLTPTC
ncbi:unnamed protein product [Camellia sinensis]